MKVDVLGLGMLGCMSRALRPARRAQGDQASISRRSRPRTRATYAMIRKADTLGVFQIESRAQMAMLPRIKPRTFYDLVIEVAIVRPGPIQGDMVHPYLRRREGHGAGRLSEAGAGDRCSARRSACRCSRSRRCGSRSNAPASPPGEADQLRRSMATFKFTGGVSQFRDKLIAGMVANGYDRRHSPSGPSSSSRASAATAFRKATRPPSR